MAKLPNNYIEILTYLRDCHPDGMTTGEILALAKKNRYYEFQNSTQISSAIFYMRAKKLVTTFEAHGGKIHKITAHGIVQLDDEIGPPSTQPIVMSTEPIDDIIQDIQDGADESQAPEQPARSIAENIVSPSVRFCQDPEPAKATAADLENEIHTALQSIGQLINVIGIAVDGIASAETANPVIKIDDKAEKMSLLLQLADSPFFEPYISDMLGEIRADIERMEDVK